jgi:hypothetical protein
MEAAGEEREKLSRPLTTRLRAFLKSSTKARRVRNAVQ